MSVFWFSVECLVRDLRRCPAVKPLLIKQKGHHAGAFPWMKNWELSFERILEQAQGAGLGDILRQNPELKAPWLKTLEQVKARKIELALDPESCSEIGKNWYRDQEYAEGLDEEWTELTPPNEREKIEKDMATLEKLAFSLSRLGVFDLLAAGRFLCMFVTYFPNLNENHSPHRPNHRNSSITIY